MVREGGYLALVANRDFLLQSYKGVLSHQGFVVEGLVRGLFVFVEILHLRLARQKTQYKETMPLVLSNPILWCNFFKIRDYRILCVKIP